MAKHQLAAVKNCKPEKRNKLLKAVQHLVISPFAENRLVDFNSVAFVLLLSVNMHVRVQRLLLPSFGSERQLYVLTLGVAGNRKRHIFGQISGIIGVFVCIACPEMQMFECIFSHHLGTGSHGAAKVLQIDVAPFKNRSLFFQISYFYLSAAHSFVAR